jgi:hypothetical protein
MKKIILAGLVAGVAMNGTAFAQKQAPTVVRGTIDSINGNALTITDRAGDKMSLTLEPGATITEIVQSKLSDVKAGSYVGTAAIPMPNGQLRAMELQVFPENMRGTGAGSRAWNLAPKSTMTNGTVGSLVHGDGTINSVNGTGDLTITVTYGNVKKTVLVPATVPVVTYEPGTSGDLKVGAHILLFAMQTANGSWASSRINVGKDGLIPPM